MASTHLYEGKPPPHDLDAEAAVLATVLLVSESFDAVVDLLQPQSFYSESHRQIFEAAAACRNAGQPIDIVTVGSHLKATDRLGQVGGMAYMTEILNAVPAVSNVRAYAKIVAETCRLRQTAELLHRSVGQIYAGIEDTQSFLDDVAGRVQALSEHRNDDTMQSIAHFAAIAMAENANEGPSTTSVLTGLRDFDRETGGLFDGDLIVVAGRPGMGKSALAFQWLGVVADAGIGASGFSIEMRGEEIANRQMCGWARVPISRIRARQLTFEDRRKLAAAAAHISRLAHYQIDPTKVGVQDMRSKLRKRVRELAKVGKRLGIVVVDYLQIMKPPHGAQNREQEISETTRELKAMAKEFKVPIVALSQLNRSVESRADKRPQMSDLRESGAIEQDADSIIFVYRDEYYDREKSPGEAELIVAKNRHGPTGTVHVGFHKDTTTFHDLENHQ